MVDIKSRLTSVTEGPVGNAVGSVKDSVTGSVKDNVLDRGKWAARGASFTGKLKATKAVWFPPEPVKAGSKGAAAAKKTTKRTAKKSTSTAKKGTSSAKKAAGRAT